MKRKLKNLLALAICLCLVLSMVPGLPLVVRAAGEVAKVTDGDGALVGTYATIDMAISNWTEGTTLTLLADIPALGDTVEVTTPGLVLDLNGHKMKTADYWSDEIFAVHDSGELTIRDTAGNGSFEASRVLYNYSGGKITLESGNMIGEVFCNSDFTMTGGTITGGFTVNSPSAKTRLMSGQISGNPAVYNNSDDMVLGGNLTVTSTTGVAVLSWHPITISGTPVISGGACDLQLGSIATLNTQPVDDTWSVELMDSFREEYNGVFAVPGSELEEELDPAKFTSADVHYVVKRLENGSLALEYCTHTFDSATGLCTVCGDPCIHTYDTTTGICSVCGKTCDHDVNPTTGACEICGYGCEHVMNPENGVCTLCGYGCTHTFDATTGLCSICGDNLALVKIGNTYYDVFDNTVIEKWTGGTTMTLLSDLEGEFGVEVDQAPVVLDLNGHTVSLVYGIEILSSGDLTITDTSVDGDGVIGSSADGNSTLDVQGTLTLTGGKVTKAAKYAQAIICNYGGTLNITGGTVENTLGTALNVQRNTDCRITGGTFLGGEGQRDISFVSAEDPVISGTVNVNDPLDIYVGVALDLSGAKNAEGWRIVAGSDLTVGDNLLLPQGMELQIDTNKIETLVGGQEAVISHPHTGGQATCDARANCEICGKPYGTTPPHNFDEDGWCTVCNNQASISVTDNHMTFYAADVNSLQTAVANMLETGSTAFTVNLPADADGMLITAIRRALDSAYKDDVIGSNSIDLTIAGVTVIPDTSINNELFGEVNHDSCEALDSIILPDVVSIGNYAFQSCRINSISAPKLQSVGNYAFGFNNGIRSLNLPELTSIGEDAFIACVNLSEVVLPKVTNIGSFAFWSCSRISRMELTAEESIALENNVFDDDYTTNIELVLRCNKADEVSGTTWSGYTFKSIATPHKVAEGSHKCSCGGETMSECADDDKDHNCDTCGDKLSDCADTDKDHNCDTCGDKLSECADNNSDHNCDTCGTKLSECADTDSDHNCDTCGTKLSDCADNNSDHNCDTCGTKLSDCADTDKDHNCDTCGDKLSDCADTDSDHNCDTCGDKLSECADTDKDHNCDTCGTKLSECADTDKDHNCDTCGDKLSDCADTDKDHNCDTCGDKLSECADANNDHNCDLCGDKLSDCADTDSDHNCDTCGKKLSDCGDTKPADHKCDICGKVLTTCGDENEDGKCDVCGAITVPAKPYNIVNVVSGVHVYWKTVPGAAKYGLWRSETGKNGTYKWIANPTVPHFTDTKVESGKTYYYKVTTMVADGTHSNKSDAIGITYVGTPDITSRVNKAAGITVGWNKIEGAQGYAIYRKSYSGNDAWVRVGTVKGNATFTWTDTSVKNNNGTVYKYTIRALAGSDMKTLSGCRNTGRTMARLTSRVLNSAVKASATSIKCSWTTSSVVTGYEVRFMVGSTVYKTFTVGDYKIGVKTFTGLKAGQTYKIQVRSYLKVDGMGFYSAWSTAKTVKLP